MCRLGDHSLEDFPKIIEKVLSKRTVNLLQTVPKHDILNLKNLHVVTRSGVGRDNSNHNQQVIQRIKNTTKHPYMCMQNDTMETIVEFFMKEADEQRLSKDVILEGLLDLLEEEHLVGCLIGLLNMLKHCNQNREKCKKCMTTLTRKENGRS